MTGEPPPLREVIDAYGLGAKKSLGQHFLLDLNITRKIARMGAVSKNDAVFEVGPGPGGLTRAALEAGASITAVERDARCIAALEANWAGTFPGKLRLIEADALRADETALLAKQRPSKSSQTCPTTFQPSFWSNG